MLLLKPVAKKTQLCPWIYKLLFLNTGILHSLQLVAFNIT